jgi:hypothetical protein
MMNNKRGWMRILEATIAVLIVTGVLIVVYSRQVDRGVDPVDYFRNLQGQILADISINSGLRVSVLNVTNDEAGDPNFDVIHDFVLGRVPDFVEFSIAICNLSSESDNCMMNSADVIKTLDKSVFVEDMIISSDLGDGSGAIYIPKNFRLYMWEK